MNARDEVLGRVREAIGESEELPIERTYHNAGARPAEAAALLELLTARLIDYKATVLRCADSDQAIAAAVTGVLSARSVTRLVVPVGLPEVWLAAEHRQPDDPPLTVGILDRAEGVLTGSAVAIAETGTIVLDASPSCGRRVITLVPDLHIVVVRAADVVPTVPDGVARLDPSRPLTFISGPSATSDIELNRVEGVHGPRQLVVILAG
ncbi:MAG: L-lactate dehydrogenase complex protein LldG [Pseudonocardiales bacterium]|jgi:L-lactate dehydrogenase complex protein LldG|nr:L-lactate dehydrogenase complex protein LldG [Pseudonocardiales bacterium]